LGTFPPRSDTTAITGIGWNFAMPSGGAGSLVTVA